ncbi:glucose-6-phosphate isomerase [Thalassotalea agarivorans]|uniref:Glucose-6-phosphate isomerase n=1 Tax=Thalassotalea agarivorans TaxID=349064 RepID=A0A1I0GAW6_THASX|nr:glucose-6-phosphate isomerase [Thalassotalea agarivorans]SET68113.1 glucose-6-phosphate isomerase [Thalassotalea agarivorans]
MLTESSQWQALQSHFESIKNTHMRDLFAQNDNRFLQFSMQASGITLDFSKNRITDETFALLIDLAKAANISGARDGMFAGEKINSTEKRAVLHTALRHFGDNQVKVDGEDVMPVIKQTLAKIKAYVNGIVSGETKGYTGKAFTDVISVGIGGSFLGPKIMSEALKPYQNHIKVHYVANVDGCHMQDVVAKLDPETTLIVTSSKTLTTQETLRNMQSARQWFVEQAGEAHIAKHFACVSTNVEGAKALGIDPENVFPMWDWVGGRYSVWSAIGLPLALGIGYDNFEAFLQGAYDMDQHFCDAPLEQNMPVIMALLGIWYRNFFGAQSHVLLPYYHYLRGLPAYVQQLDMESNGKFVTKQDTVVNYETGPIIWGSEGTNGQHSFHQLIHQGATIIPADFMLPLYPHHDVADHHAMLASNCFGQTQALMAGQTVEEIKANLAGKVDESEIDSLAQHKEMPGNKPSNTLIFDRLDPKTLGSLIALYEHKVFVQGVIWDVNSYDQWGVELGKALGNQVLSKLVNKDEALDNDASTNALIEIFRKR